MPSLKILYKTLSKLINLHARDRTKRFCLFISAMVLRIILPGRPYNDITDMDVRWPGHDIVNRIGNITHFRDRAEFICHGLDYLIRISGNRLEAAEH